MSRADLDLSGRRFGRLLVLHRVPKPEHVTGPYSPYRRFWAVACDCGNTTVACHKDLLAPNHTRSCGCLQAETSIANLGDPREASLRGWSGRAMTREQAEAALERARLVGRKVVAKELGRSPESLGHTWRRFGLPGVREARRAKG
jgi:hypothetical protein